VTSDRRTALTRAGVRALAGAAGLAASAVVVIAAITLPLPSAQAQPAARTVTPVPATASVACPGSLLTLGTSTGSGSGSGTAQLAGLGAPTVVSGGDSSSPASVPISAADVQTKSTGLLAFSEPARDAQREPLLAAAQSLAANSPELRGFAAANCAQPDFEQWLVGGATSLGSTTLVVLGNPGDVAATVDVAVYTEQGLAQAAGGRGILVQPHTQRVVPLAGLAPNASATVVHVTSTGGTVSAVLQESAISGVTPQGAEWVGPATAPGKKLVIPGTVIDASGLSAAAATDAGDGGAPVLRVLPVGGADAKLTIGVRADNGAGGGTASTASASHGVVSEIPLSHVGAGTYTVTVDSTEPIVAAVHASTADATAGTDFTWFPAAAPLTGAVAVPIAPGPSAVMHLANESSSKITLKLDGPGGGTVSVPAGASISRPQGTRGVQTTMDAQGLYVSVSYAGPGQIASYAAYPTGASASALTVYKR
jgi:hypothetical protein